MNLLVCKKFRGGGNSLSYLFIGFLMFGAAISAKADVVDLGGETISKTGAEFKSAYNNNTIENGTVTVSSAHDNENMASGVYTIGNGATLTSDNIHQNGNLTLTVAGGTYISTGYITMPFRYGNQVLVLDNGVLSHTSSATASGVPQTVNIGYTWNNKDSSKGKNISARAVVVNGSRFEMTKSGNLGLGMNKAHERKINTMKVDFAVTNSTVFVSSGQIIMSGTDNAWISDTANSYVHAVFGPGADLTFKQIYAKGSYPAPSAIFDGATIHWVAGGNSFIGQASSVSGDIYEIQENGLTVDIPEGGALSCDVNSSALKGDGGIVKVGNGSITWNEITSSGSGRHLFSGPLVVSNGTWTSTLSYAATKFAVDGASSTLALSGSLTAAAPDFSITAGGTLDLTSEEPKDRTAGTLKFGENAVLKLNGGAMGVDSFFATSLDLAATAANPVKIEFTDAANISGGAYTLVAITGGGTFAAGDETKFALDANAPEGSTLSVSGSALVLNVPVTNPATWTGNALDGKFSTPGNWLGNVVPGADDEIEIKATAEVELDCDLAIAVKSLSIHFDSAKVTIGGSGAIAISGNIVNASEFRPVVNVPVEFKSGEDYAPIDVTGEVEFSGGVKGTVPANHSTFYGKYTLTATSLTLSSAITLAANATVTATDMELKLSGTNVLNAEAGSSMTVKYIKPTNADTIGSFAGILTATNQLFPEGANPNLSFDSGFTGVLKTKEIKYHTAGYSRTFSLALDPSAEVVLGGVGVNVMQGTIRIAGCSLRSSADWSFTSCKNGYNKKSTIDIGSAGITVDTSDYYDSSAAGHTVYVKTDNSNYSDDILSGTGGVIVNGNGQFVFQKSALFTGTLAVNDSVALNVNAGVAPGMGNVTINGTATFNLAQSGTGTVPVSGTLTMAGGTTLRIPTLAGGVLPLSVNALAFDGVTAENKVALNIEGGELVPGFNAIIQSTTALPANAWDNFAVTLGATVPSGMETLYIAQGNTLYILVKGGSDAIWTGGGETANFNNSDNWLGGQIPGNGSCVQIAAADEATLVNDIPGFSPASITFAAGSTAVTITGENAINVTSITNLSSSVQNIACRINFVDTYRVHCATQPVNFSGGAYATYPDASITSDTMASHTLMGEIHFTEDWTIPDQPANKPFAVAPNARVYGKTVTAQNYQNTNYHLRIDTGAIAEFETVAVAGKLVFRLNGGDLRAKGDVTLGGENKRDFGYYNADNSGTVEAHGIYKNVTGNGLIYQYITSMVVGAGGYGMYRKDYSIQFCKDLRLTAKADLSIHKPIAEDGPKNGDWGLYLNGKTFTIDTAGHTVIFDSYVGNGANATSGAIVKEGEGELVMASLEKRYSGATTVNGGTLKVVQLVKGLGTGGVTVNDGGTLALVPGVTLSNSSVSVENGGAFACAESGTVVLGSDLNLADGAKLKFTFSKRNIAPVLDVAEKTVTLGENKALTVAIDGVKRPCAGRHVLTSGGKFAGAVVSLDANQPKWVLGVGVNDEGNIYADIKPIGTRIIVR